MSATGTGPDRDPSTVRPPRRARDLLVQLGDRVRPAAADDPLTAGGEPAGDQWHRADLHLPAERRRAHALEQDSLLAGDPATVIAVAPEPEPPAHLARALKAAATARARAARIRAGQLQPEPEDAHWWGPGSSAELAGAHRSKPARASRSQKPRFSRTVAAATEARSLVSGDESDPWQLCLRDDAAARGATTGWLTRLLHPLSPDRKRAPADEARWAIAPPAAATPSMPARPAPSKPARRERGAAPASGRSAGRHPAPERARAIAGPAPVPLETGVDPEVLRLLPPVGPTSRAEGPRPRPEEMAGELPDSAFGDQGVARFAFAPPPPTGGSGRWGSGKRARRRRAIGFDGATRAHAGGAGQPHGYLTSAVAAGDNDRAGGVLSYPIVPLGARTDRAPALVPGAWPVSRLADVLAGTDSAADRTSEPDAGPPQRPPCARPTAPAERAAGVMAITAAMAAGFLFCMVANGTLLLTGAKLGEAWLALTTPTLEDPPGAGVASDPTRATGPAVHAGLETTPLSASVHGLAIGSGHAGQGVIDVGPKLMAETTAPALAAAPPPVWANQTGALGSAVVKGMPEREGASSASVARPAALEAKAIAWQTFYDQGHRLQRAGELVAAAEAYREASRLNPQQPAILYDLGYVLQMQGQGDAAIEHYRRAIAHQPAHAYAHYNLATLLQGKGDPRAAIRHYEIAAGLQPDNAYVHYDWARSLEAIGDAAGATTLYQKAIALGPDDRPGVDARRRLAALARPGVDQASID